MCASPWATSPAPARGKHGATAEDIVIETLAAEVSERGATRMDDKTSEASMEKRKKDGSSLQAWAPRLLPSQQGFAGRATPPARRPDPGRV
jgi:hypothetical protein